jgi:nucleotide-binding universal stress UspA family protein
MAEREHHPVVVGVDGSESALHAAQWAANEAIRRGVPLRLVHAFELPFRYPTSITEEDSIHTAMREQANHALAKAVEVATAAAPGTPVEQAVIGGTPVEVLVQESTTATTLVLGTRGLGGFRGLLIGSNAVALAGRAHCPLVVIRGTNAPLLSRPVVVGVDGTHTSEAALGFAFQAAAARGVGLVTVHCWTDPIVASAMAAGAVIVVDPQVEQEATTVLAEQLASWQQKYPDVPVTQHVVRDSPSRALLHFADTAQLVVVGSRGRGGFTGLVLGSTSQHLLHHAPCPVAVVRTDADQ